MTYHQPASLYDLSFAKFASTLKPPTTSDTISSCNYRELDCLPRSIQREFCQKATVCSICAKIRMDKTLQILIITTKKPYSRESLVCTSCLVEFKCELCAQRVNKKEYLDFVEGFTFLELWYDFPTIITLCAQQNGNYRVRCYRCDDDLYPYNYSYL